MVMFIFRKNNRSANNTKIIGIAGTRGKTISARMVAYMLQNMEFKVSLLDSDGYIFTDQSKEDFNVHLANSKDIKNFVAKSTKDNYDFLIFEVTSKNILNKVYDGTMFDLGVITNLYDDNIDLYTYFDRYVDTKFQFIKNIKNFGKLITFKNIEPIVYKYENKIKQNVYYNTLDFENIINASLKPDGLSFEYKDRLIDLKAIGIYNFENALMSIALVENLIGDVNTQSLQNFSLPKGRMSLIEVNNIKLIIDSSRHPDSIESSIKHLYQTKLSSAKLITVGGSSEKYKKYRKKYSESLTKYADLNILTIDDTYTEDVVNVNSEVINYARFLNGVTVDEFYSKENYEISDKNRIAKRIDMVIDRKDKPFLLFSYGNLYARLNAIEFALNYAKPGDIVYIYGKGNSNKMCLKNTMYNWNDFEVVEYVISNLKI